MASVKRMRQEPTEKIQEIDDYEFRATLGEGAFGKVKLALHRPSKDLFAIKIIMAPRGTASLCVKKEVCIHRTLLHANIIRFITALQSPNATFLILEYAAGGELFDQIIPEVGLRQGEGVAVIYMRQLFSAVGHLHSLGVAHRDIKPENILLDVCGNIKLTDFGFATVYQHQGRRRKLEQKCGSPPYMAPELLAGVPYEGPLADMWSCGIVMIVMLSGVLPWNEPHARCELYARWRSGKHDALPWSCTSPLMSLEAVDLALTVLEPNPRNRSLHHVALTHSWITRRVSEEVQLNTEGLFHEPAMELVEEMDALQLNPSQQNNANVNNTNDDDSQDNQSQSLFGLASQSLPKRPRLAYPPASAPTIPHFSDSLDNSHELYPADTQPIEAHEVFFEESSQQPCTEARMLCARRSTRFYGTVPIGSLMDRLCRAMTHLRLVPDVKRAKQTIVVRHVGTAGEPVEISVRLTRVKRDLTGAEFRRKKGDGMTFKNLFAKIVSQMSDIRAKDYESLSQKPVRPRESQVAVL